MAGVVNPGRVATVGSVTEGQPLVQTDQGYYNPVTQTYTPGTMVGSTIVYQPTASTNATVGDSNQMKPPSEGGTGGGGTDTTVDMSAKYDALAALSGQFKAWGIDLDGSGLASQLWQWIVDDRSDEGIMTELRSTKAYNDRFTGMAALVKRGQFMDEATYIRQEAGYRTVLQNWDIPSGFYDSYDDFGKFIANGLSIKELDDRVRSAKTFLDTADTSYKSALTQLGLGEGTLLAYVLDGDRAQQAIVRDMKAAAIGGAANKYGFGLDATDMQKYGDTLGQQYDTIGADQKQALEGSLSQLGQLADQDQRLSGIDNTAFDRRDTLDANLLNDSKKQLASKTRAEREAARFSGSSGFTTASLSTSGAF